MANFALVGASGYIAPRHLQAISDTGNNLVAAIDLHDSVGIMDRYFPDASFFTEIERFDRHLEKLRLNDHPDKIDYLSVCSPNYLHDAHSRLGLRVGANVICEKPLVVNPWNLDQLEKIEELYGGKVYNVLQLRIHPGLLKIKEQLDSQNSNTKHEVDLTYITPRGSWYDVSWKGAIEKSGGITTNIGIHLFDMMLWMFGPVQRFEVHVAEAHKYSGVIELQNANVKWFLSIDRNDLPESYDNSGNKAYRLLTFDGEEVEFSGGFTDLHTRVYEDILNGRGFGINHVRPAIELAYNLRTSDVVAPTSGIHSFAKKVLEK